MSNTSDNAPATPSKPIPIHRRRRRRSNSSAESTTESDSPVDSAVDDNSPPRVVIRTPPSVSPVRISPSTSPILSYFFPTSPTAKSPLAVGKTVLGYPTVVEDEEAAEPDIPSAAHARRLSNTWSGPRLPVTTPGADDRTAGLLRRLSLGAAFAKSPPQGAGAAPALPTLPQRSQAPQPPASPSVRTRRSHTLAAPPQARPRAPSPMGERILKGHFDGFN